MDNADKPQSVQMKICHKDELRRIIFKDVSFRSMMKEIRSRFTFGENVQFQVKYQDDEGDWVTIGSDAELVFALKLFPNKILKTHVFFDKTPNWLNRNQPKQFQTRTDEAQKLGKMSARFVKHVTVEDDCNFFSRCFLFQNLAIQKYYSNKLARELLPYFHWKTQRRSNGWS